MIEYKDRKGCVWHRIKADDNNHHFIYAIKVRDEKGNKLYNWKPKRIKSEYLFPFYSWEK